MTLPDNHLLRRTETVRITIPVDLRPAVGAPPEPPPEQPPQDEAGDDRRASPRRIAQRNRAYQQLLGSLYDAILVTDGEGRIIDVNDRAVHLLHRDREEMSGMCVTQFVDGADSNLLAELRDSTSGGAFTVIEAWCMRRDGSEFPAEIAVHGIALTDEGQMCFMIRDISRRLQMERDVIRLSKAVASTSDAVVVFDAEGRHLYHNAACEQLVALDQPETFRLGQLLPTGNLGETVAAAVQAGEGWNGEIELPGRRDGTAVLFRADAIDMGGERKESVVILTDITRRKEDERRLRETLRELERSNADLAQLAYVASHDLKEPLRAITGYLHLLDRRWGGQLEETAQQYLRNAVEGAGRMKEMINHILEYSRLNPQAGPFAPVDSAAILAQAQANLGQLIRDREGRIEIEGTMPKVRVSAARLLQVFQNLLANGLKFCKDKPRVTVTTETTPEEVVFRVADNGIGIDPALVDRVFMLFQRLHTQREYEGTGIGLATCRKLVEQWGGKIWVDSSLPGMGTVFAFSVPNPPPARRAEPPDES